MNIKPAPEPREVELVFEDEANADQRGERAYASSTTPSDSAMPRFPQSPRPRFERAEGPADRGAAEGGLPPRAHDGGDDFVTVVLPQGRISTGACAATLIGGAVLSLFAANVSGAFALPGVTTLLSAASGPLLASANIVLGLLSPFGAILMVFAAWSVLARRGYRHAGFALLISMWTAWIASVAVGSFAVGAVPVMILGLAFCSAATVAASTLAKKHSVRAVRGIRALGAILFAAVGALLIAAGSATLIGAIVSGVVGWIGALLGVRAWNRWWAPMIDTREQVRRAMRRAFRARMA